MSISLSAAFMFMLLSSIPCESYWYCNTVLCIDLACWYRLVSSFKCFFCFLIYSFETAPQDCLHLFSLIRSLTSLYERRCAYDLRGFVIFTCFKVGVSWNSFKYVTFLSSTVSSSIGSVEFSNELSSLIFSV